MMGGKGMVASVCMTVVICLSCASKETSNCTDKYREIQRILRIPHQNVDSSNMRDLYELTRTELSCDTISTLFVRATYRCLAFHGYHQRALDVALDERFKSRRKLFDTLYITCLYLRLGDTTNARRLIGRAMIGRDVVIDPVEAADVRGMTRTSTLGLLLARHLGVTVDTTKIAQFRSMIPRVVTPEFNLMSSDLDLFIAMMLPDKQIDIER